MKRFYAAMVTGLLLVSGGALADGGVTVKLPDISAISDDEAKALIQQLAEVNVITSNCPDYEISTGEWTLVTETGDLLAQKLGLDAQEYDRTYYGPAFRLLDEEGSCDKIGPSAKPLIERLVEMGGDTKPISAAKSN